MEKALEILTYMKASINDEEETHEKLDNMSESELHQYLNEAIAELEEAMQPKTCEWKQCTSEYDTSWEGTCGVKWLLIDGTPTENHMQFCPQCGGKLIEIEPKDNA